MPVKLCHICVIPLEQDPDSTAWLETALCYFNKMGFFLVCMLSVCIRTNSPFDKTLQKIINFNSYSTAKAAQLGGKHNWALYSKTGVFKRIMRKKRKDYRFSSASGVQCICVINVSNPLKTTPIETSYLGWFAFQII